MTEQNLSPALTEALSALMDNEASELEVQRLLKTLEQEPELKATWSRYQIIGAGLKGDVPPLASVDFASRVSAAIADEEPLMGNATVNDAQKKVEKVNAKPWWQFAGQAAIAASVAGALILGVQQYQLDPGAAPIANVTTPSATETRAANLPSGINAPALSARTVAVQSGYESRPQENRRVMFVPRQEAGPIYNEDISAYVNQLIQEHTDNAATNTGQGMLPYTRVILIEED